MLNDYLLFDCHFYFIFVVVIVESITRLTVVWVVIVSAARIFML